MGASSDDGFTLVELLVGLALLGLAAVLVGQGVLFGRAALNRVEQRTEEGEGVAAVQTLVRDRLEHLYADPRYDNLSMFVDFDGEPSAMQFIASAPGPTGGGAALQRFALELRGDRLAFGPITTRGETADRPPPAVLDGVQGLTIAYWGPGASDATPLWRTEWSRRAIPPQLIRIRVALAAGDRRRWPDLIVRPAPALDADCLYDAAKDGCRGGS